MLQTHGHETFPSPNHPKWRTIPPNLPRVEGDARRRPRLRPPTRRRLRLPPQPPVLPNPATTADTDDPGDATQRNYRYQHAYGAILLASARRGEVPYLAIWCEHHEDLLAERTDGTYDGYQIKTSQPEHDPSK